MIRKYDLICILKLWKDRNGYIKFPNLFKKNGAKKMLQIDKVGSYFEDHSQYVERRFSLTADKYINFKNVLGY